MSISNPYPEHDKRERSPGDIVYYVNPTGGDDSRNGRSSEAAWKTTLKLNALQLAAGDRVELLPGRYNYSLCLTGEGSAEKPVVIHFAPGTYDFYPEQAFRLAMFIPNDADDGDAPKAIALAVRKARHFRIEGSAEDGVKSDLIMHGIMIESFLDACEEVELKGLGFDYHRPTVSELALTRVTAKYAEATVHPDSRYAIRDGNLIWIGDGWEQKATGSGSGLLHQAYIHETLHTWRVGNPMKSITTVEEIEPFKLRLHYTQKPDQFEEGVEFLARDTFRECAGSYVRYCKNVTWTDCNYYFLNGMGVINLFCENLTLTRVQLAPRAGSGRRTSMWADGFHVTFAKGLMKLVDCRFTGSHDDSINIHTAYLPMVEKLTDHKWRVHFPHRQTYGFLAFHPGDEVAIVHGPSLQTTSTNRVVESEMAGTHHNIVTFEKPISGEFTDKTLLENLTWNPEIVIRGCVSEATPTYGFALKSNRKTLVEGCRFKGTHIAAVALAQYADDFFCEGALANGVTIRGNTFDGCEKAVIVVSPGNSEDRGPLNFDILIDDNDFGKSIPRAVIKAKSVKGLTIINNRFAFDELPQIETTESFDVRIENILTGQDGRRTEDAVDKQMLDFRVAPGCTAWLPTAWPKR